MQRRVKTYQSHGKGTTLLELGAESKGADEGSELRAGPSAKVSDTAASGAPVAATSAEEIDPVVDSSRLAAAGAFNTRRTFSSANGTRPGKSVSVTDDAPSRWAAIPTTPGIETDTGPSDATCGSGRVNGENKEEWGWDVAATNNLWE